VCLPRIWLVHVRCRWNEVRAIEVTGVRSSCAKHRDYHEESIALGVQPVATQRRRDLRYAAAPFTKRPAAARALTSTARSVRRRGKPRGAYCVEHQSSESTSCDETAIAWRRYMKRRILSTTKWLNAATGAPTRRPHAGPCSAA